MIKGKCFVSYFGNKAVFISPNQSYFELVCIYDEEANMNKTFPFKKALYCCFIEVVLTLLQNRLKLTF